MSSLAVDMSCAACGARLAPKALPFRCPSADVGDNRDHLLQRRIDAASLSFGLDGLDDTETNPFVRFRQLLYSYQRYRAAGGTDSGFVQLVRTIDEAVARVDGHGFAVTPLQQSDPLGKELGLRCVWVKDETHNVAGSHKARHQLGIMLYLIAMAERGVLDEAVSEQALAVASCGNAALAAGVVAAAAGRQLQVFIPPDADAAVVRQLEALGARLTRCPRKPGEVGDPCYLRFSEALTGGALPLSVQGNQNGLAIEGGMTLGFELIVELCRRGVQLDRLLIQVGGGALASSCIQAFREALALGLIDRLPRFHAVQTASAAPLARAYQRLVTSVDPNVTTRFDMVGASGLRQREETAERLAASQLAVERSKWLRHALDHRDQYMSPWEQTPRSVAHGILDDETYDWHAICAGMLDSGGCPITVDEETLQRANDIGRGATGIAVDYTGTSGLAGLLLLAEQQLTGHEEQIAVLFTGRLR